MAKSKQWWCCTADYPEHDTSCPNRECGECRHNPPRSCCRCRRPQGHDGNHHIGIFNWTNEAASRPEKGQ